MFGCGDTRLGGNVPGGAQRCSTAELEEHGATRIHPRGEGNANGDFDGHYRAWHGGLWADLATALHLPAERGRPQAPPGRGCPSRSSTGRLTNPVVASYEADARLVTRNRELSTGIGGPRERSTRHLEIALPGGMHLPGG